MAQRYLGVCRTFFLSFIFFIVWSGWIPHCQWCRSPSLTLDSCVHLLWLKARRLLFQRSNSDKCGRESVRQFNLSPPLIFSFFCPSQFFILKLYVQFENKYFLQYHIWGFWRGYHFVYICIEDWALNAPPPPLPEPPPHLSLSHFSPLPLCYNMNHSWADEGMNTYILSSVSPFDLTWD